MTENIARLLVALFIVGVGGTTALAKSKITEPLSYEEVKKITVDLGEDAQKIAKKLVGKTVRLHLMPVHPAEIKNLVVNVEDSIYFYCNERPAGFREGVVTAKIIKVENTPDDGAPWFTLDRCIK